MHSFSKYLLLCFCLCLAGWTNVFSQDRTIDSLNNLLRSKLHDTARINVLNRLSFELINTDRYAAADSLSREAVAMAGALEFKRGLAVAYNNMGLAFDYQGNFAAALQYYFKSLKINEQMGFAKGIASKYNNIGIVYQEMGDLPKALEYYLKAFQLNEKNKSKRQMANNLTNIGTIYEDFHEYDKALEHYLKAMKIDEELGNEDGMGFNKGNIGVIYLHRGDTLSAIKWCSEALQIDEKLGNNNGIVRHLGNLGGIYTMQKKFAKAESFLLRALKLCKEAGYLRSKKICCESLSDLYSRQKKWLPAIHYYKDFIAAKDSLLNEESTRKGVQTEMRYEFDKKEAAAKMEQERKDALAREESEKQRLILWGVCGVLALVAGFAAFAYRSYLRKRNDNIKIRKQKAIIELKQKEILDSIHYANRIQKALLTGEKYIDKTLEKLKENKST